MSPHLLAELLDVLRRDKFRDYLTLEEADLYVSGIASHGETVADPETVEPLVRDPKDDYLIALARTAAVDAIVSGDGDLIALNPTEPPVVTPASLAAAIRPAP